MFLRIPGVIVAYTTVIQCSCSCKLTGLKKYSLIDINPQEEIDGTEFEGPSWPFNMLPTSDEKKGPNSILAKIPANTFNF